MIKKIYRLIEYYVFGIKGYGVPKMKNPPSRPKKILKKPGS